MVLAVVFLIHQHIECEYKKVDKVLVLGFN